MGIVEDVVAYILQYIIWPAIATIANWTKSMWNSITGLMSAVYDKINDFYESYIEPWISWLYNRIEETRSTLFGQIADIWKAIGNIGGGVADWLINWINDIVASISSTKDWIVNWATDWITNIVDSIYKKIDSITSWVSGLWEGFTNWLDDTWEGFSDWVTSGINSLSSWVDDAFKNIGSWWDSTWEDVRTTVMGWVDSAVDWITNAFNDFLDWINELPGTIADWVGEQIQGAMDWVEENLPNWVGAMFEWAKPIVQPILDAASWLGQINELLTGKAPKEQAIIDTEGKQKEIQTEIDHILDEIKG